MKKMIIMLLIVSLLLPTTTAFAYSIQKVSGGYNINFSYDDDGWTTKDMFVYYLDHGNMRTGWQYIDSNWYYFNKVGDMLTHMWVNTSGNWYYLNTDGKLATSCYVDGYYVDENGTYIPSRNNLSFGSGIFDENGNEVYTTVYKSKTVGNFINVDNNPISINYNKLNSLGDDPYPVVDKTYWDDNEAKHGKLLWCIDEDSI